MSNRITPQREFLGETWDAHTAETANLMFERLFSILAGFSPGSPIPNGEEGDLLIGGTGGVFERLGKSTSSTRSLTNTGTNNRPAWALVDLASGVQGQLPVTALDVTGTPDSSTVLFGDRWDGLPGGLVDLSERNYAALVARPTSQVVGIGTRAGTIAGASFLQNHHTDSTYGQHLTGAVAGNAAGHESADLICQPQHDPTFYSVLHTGADITSVRYWIGVTIQANFLDVDDQGGANHYAAFRYSTVAGDAGWVGTTRDGTAQNVTAAVASIAAATKYVLKIRFTSTAVYFSVNGGTEVASSSNLPGSTQILRLSSRVITQAAASRHYDWSRDLIVYGS